MEKLIVKEICKNLKWYERIIVRVLWRTFAKAYHMGRIVAFNKKLEDMRLSSSNKII